MGDKGKASAVSGVFVLTSAAGKKLIGKAVAALPEVQYALRNARMMIANGTTTSYVIEALTGQPLERFAYCIGVVTQGKLTQNAYSGERVVG